MPKNFPEVWSKRVRRNISEAIVAPWLEGVSEIDSPVIEIGAGTTSEKNIIHIPKTMFKPDVLINNTTYPIASQPYTDDEDIYQLDKYQTLVTTVHDDDIIGASYDKIDVVTKTHTEAIAEKKYGKAIHSFAPDSNTEDTPVLRTTGELAGGRRRLTYADLVALRSKFKQKSQRRLVLSDDHWNDLLLDRDRFGDKLVNHSTGDPAPVIAGWSIFTYENNPLFDIAALTKVPFGAVGGSGKGIASVAFCVDRVVKKTGLTKQYFAAASADPNNQTNRLSYRHYFLALPYEKAYLGALVDANS